MIKEHELRIAGLDSGGAKRVEEVVENSKLTVRETKQDNRENLTGSSFRGVKRGVKRSDRYS